MPVTVEQHPPVQHDASAVRLYDELGAMRWVLVDIAISAVVLLAVNLLEKKQKAGARK